MHSEAIESIRSGSRRTSWALIVTAGIAAALAVLPHAL